MIEILIVDDSSMSRMILEEVFSRDPELKVVGKAANGKEALEFLKRHKPDIVTMDVVMPELDGFETTRLIMEQFPLPTVIVTASFKPHEVEKTFKAIEAGAVSIFPKLGSLNAPDFEKKAKELCETIKTMAGVKVVRRWPNKMPPRKKARLNHPILKENYKVAIIGIGASTGGPEALKEIFTNLPENFPLPILVVQHIGGEFMEGMLQWMRKTCIIPIHLAYSGQKIEGGNIYFAPDNYHMEVKNNNLITLNHKEFVSGVRPSATLLFNSIAAMYGSKSMGILLTGMGNDGAIGMKAIKNAGGETIVQNEKSCIVYGMPAEAVKLDAVKYILNPHAIVDKIIQIITQNQTYPETKEASQ